MKKVLYFVNSNNLVYVEVYDALSIEIVNSKKQATTLNPREVLQEAKF